MLLNDNNDLIISRKAEEVLDNLRPGFAENGGEINFVGYSDGVVRVHYSGFYIGYSANVKALEEMVTRELKIAISEIEVVEFV